MNKSFIAKYKKFSDQIERRHRFKGIVHLFHHLKWREPTCEEQKPNGR
jgi:hypothetical protein